MKNNDHTTARLKRRSVLAAAFTLTMALAATVVGLLVNGSQLYAASAEAQTGGFVLHVHRNEVQVDVRVLDKRGRPVTDLKSTDFRIYEDGVKQQLSSLSLDNVEKLATAGTTAVEPATIDLGQVPAGQSPDGLIADHRLIVLFFDLTSMPVDDLIRALHAARQFVRTQMGAADLVSVVTYTSDLRVTQDFTNDRTEIKKALDAIQIGESSALSQAGTEGEAGATNASGQTVVNQNVSDAFTPDETEFNIFNSDEKLAAIQSLAEMLRPLPGRKSVIQFSSGMERTGNENQAQLRATEDAANRSNVSLYTMDMRGLVALPPGGDAASASPAGTAIYTNQAISSAVSKLHGGRETLAALSSDTGGRTFYDLNDFSPAFRQVQTDNRTYYLLAYSPSNTKSDGRFRKIRVEVDRPGVRVEARPGYFAPKNFRQFTREDKSLQLQQALDQDTPYLDLPMAVETAYFLQPDHRYAVMMAAKVPGSAISFMQKSHRHQTQLDFVWRVMDSDGHTAGMLRDTLPVKISDQTYEQVLKGNLLYKGFLSLLPGNYKVKVVAREDDSGKLGTFELPLVLPAVVNGALALSSVVVSNQLQESSNKRRPRPRKRGSAALATLDVGNQVVIPSVTNVFRSDQNLYVYLESFDADSPAEKTADPSPGPEPAAPSFALIFFRRGVKISEVGPFPGKVTSSNDSRTLYFAEIPLHDFPAGRYQVQVNVMDVQANSAAFTRLPIAIMPASSPEEAKSK